MAPRLGTVVGAALVAALLPLTPATPASAASPLDGFDPAMLISDERFYDSTAETPESIQAFLSEKGANCVPNPVDGTPCLKDFTMDTPATAADAYCAALPAVIGNTAAGIISQVATACGINPQVTLVTLQKEQWLVLASGTSLTPARYAKATGAACPDFTTCDSTVANFFQQVLWMAKALRKYQAYPTNYRYVAGRWNKIQHHPETSCGSADLYIQNQATAALYIYTPYVPNAAAIANPYGEGDLCSAYGIRNFYRYLRAWFPSAVTASTAAPIVPSPPSTVTPALSGTLAEAQRVGGSATLGYETSPVTCTTSYTSGPCTKTYRYGTVTWRSSGAYTELDKAAASLTWSRWGGADRYETAALVAQNAFAASSVSVAYVASGEDFPDALAGGAAAHKAGAPLLLVLPTAIPSATADALARFTGLQRIVVLGGTGVVSDGVLNSLRSATGASVTRLAGADRDATARAISASGWAGGSSEVLIAAGEDFPDALSLANLYTAHPGPVLLAGSGGLTTAALAEIRRLGATRAYVAGGSGAVPAVVDEQLAGLGLETSRVAGLDRYATNRQAARLDHTASTQAFLAAGDNFPDGLAIGAPAALRNAPLLLTSPSCVPAATATYLRSLGATRVTVLGGTGAVSPAVTRLRLC